MAASKKSLFQVWTQSCLKRVFPHDQPPSRPIKTITLSAAKREYECFQIGVYMKHCKVNYLKAEAGVLHGSDGKQLPASCVEIFYPEYVPARWQASDQAPEDIERPAPGFFPDPLLSEWVFDVATPETPPARSIWVRVHIPHNAKPGLYRGEITIRAGRRNLKAENQSVVIPDFEKITRISFKVRVWNFTLPAKSKFLSTYWLWPAQLAKWHQLKMWSEEYWTLLEKYADDMAAHRQNVIFTPLMGSLAFTTGIPSKPSVMQFGSGQLEDQIIDIHQRGGKYSFDFSRLDRWCRLFFKRGFQRIECEHISNAVYTGMPFWVTDAKGKKSRVALRSNDPRYEYFLSELFKALWKHLGKQGWRKRFVQHISDEPGMDRFDAYKRLTEIIREAAPGLRLIDPIDDPAFAKILDIPVPIVTHYEKVLQESKRDAKDVWVYYCTAPTGAWPNRFLEYLPIRLRIYPWLFFCKGIPAVLHWGYNWWGSFMKDVHNPWDDTTANRWPSGDPMVVYPPRNAASMHAVTGSIRWEQTREAMEDYEYLVLCQKLAQQGNVKAQKILKEVSRHIAPDWTTYTRDDQYLLSVRQRIGQLLSDAGDIA
jgi:hypothetical protein